MSFTNTTKQQLLDAIDRLAQRFDYDAQNIAQAKKLVHAGMPVIIDEESGIICCGEQVQHDVPENNRRRDKKRTRRHKASSGHCTPEERHHFLDHMRGRLKDVIAESVVADPVGVVVDLLDFQGRQVALFVGLTEDEIDEHIRGAGSQVPAFVTTLSFDVALNVMPNTSPTAVEHLLKIKEVSDANGGVPVIAIMGGGNTYAVVDRPTTTLPDGNHRHR